MAASSNLPVIQSADNTAQETGPRLPSPVTQGSRLPSPVTQGPRLPSPVTQGPRLPSPVTQGPRLPSSVTQGPSLPSPWPSQPTQYPSLSLERQAVSASVSLEDFIFLPSQIEPVGKLTSTSLSGAGEAAQEAVLYPRYCTVKTEYWKFETNISKKGIERGLSPNFHIHLFLSDLYIPRIGLPILLQGNMWTDTGNVCINRSQTHECGNCGLRPRNSISRNT